MRKKFKKSSGVSLKEYREQSWSAMPDSFKFKKADYIRHGKLILKKKYQDK